MRISDWSSDVCSSDLQLARMSGAAVVLFQHAHRADGGYSLKLQPALDDLPSKDATADTARVMAGIEAMARAAPAQYLSIPRRFKRTPERVAPSACSPFGRVLGSVPSPPAPQAVNASCRASGC